MVRLLPAEVGGSSHGMSARVLTRHRPQSTARPTLPHVRPQQHRVGPYATLGLDATSMLAAEGLEEAALSAPSGLPVITHPAGSHAGPAQSARGPAAARGGHQQQPPAGTDNSSSSGGGGGGSSSCAALPEELLMLADAAAPVMLPAPCSVPPGSLDNRELDKLVGTLGRNKATWRRALLLSQWLQDSGHVLDDRLCTTLIRVCSEHGQATTALSVYEWMKAPPAVGGAGLGPTVYTYTAAMRAALAAGLLDRALQVWEDAQAADCPLDCRLCITYIEVCSRKGLTDAALAMYATMRGAPRGSKLAPTVHAYTAAMRAATEGGCWQKALDIWGDMASAGVLRTGHAFAAAMSACAAGSNWQQAVALFEDMCQAGIKPDVVSCTALISALAAAGQWQRSEAVVQWMLSTGVRPNVRTYTALLTALGNARQWQRAEEMLSLMQHSSWGGVTPNSYTYSALLKALGECGEWQRAEALFARLEQQALLGTGSGRLQQAGRQQAGAAAAGFGREPPAAAGLDEEVVPGVWGWQAASGRQGLIQRPPGSEAGSGASSGRSSLNGGASSAGGGDGSALWTSASQLHGLDLQLQHDAAASKAQQASGSSSSAGSVRSDSPAPSGSAAPSSCESSPAAAGAAALSSNMLAQQLAQLALQQQLAANVDLQLLMLQQQHYHQTQMMAAAQQQAAVQQAALPVPDPRQQQQQRRRAAQAPSVALPPPPAAASTTAGSTPAAAPGGIINEVVVGSLMQAYERAGKWQEAVGALARAAALGISANSAMLTTAISAAGEAGQLAVADALFSQARVSGLADGSTYETMVAVLGMAGDPGRAEMVFRAAQAAGLRPGEYAYTGLIAAHSLAGDAAAALRVRARMLRDGCAVSVNVYNALVAAADRAGLFDRALDLLRIMRREGVEPNALTQQLAAEVGRKGALTVEGQQITAAALSAAMAAAGTLLIRSGVF